MTKSILPNEKHLTASILVVSRELPKKILLVHHKKYDLWIQPGGHVEQFENPIEAVVRETKEEAGIDVSFLLRKIEKIDELADFLPLPDFFLEESIPLHKNTPAHFHLDMLYKVELPLQEVQMAEKELHDIGWFSLEEADKMPMFENTKVIIRKILS